MSAAWLILLPLKLQAHHSMLRCCRHVEREIEITVGVQHRRVVETFAAFEINDSTVVTVMPYCNGGSLADLLRRHGPLAEKDARSIIVQALDRTRKQDPSRATWLKHTTAISYDRLLR